MKRIEDVEKPVVGKFYEVPCVLPTESWHAGLFMPVIGPLHEDKEIIGFPSEHFHPDFRFVSDGHIRFKLHGWHHRRASESVSRRIFANVIVKFDQALGVVRKVKLCRRPHPTFPDEAPWQKDLEAAYAGKVAKCRVCPHRGVSLAGAPVRGGKLICPGHGLGFNQKTLVCEPR